MELIRKVIRLKNNKEMDEWKKDRIQACKNGKNPTFITKLKSGYVVIGDTQFLPGYCVLLYKEKVSSLNELSIEDREQFLLDMTIVGDAINEIYKPSRVNYEVLGNLDEYVHAHIFPRYDWEGEIRKSSVRRYPREKFKEENTQFVNLENKEDIKLTLKNTIDKISKNIYKE